MMGGIVTDLEGRATMRGPLRGRGVLVHRPSRRQPPRLQFADRVLRVRLARGARRDARARPDPSSLSRTPAASVAPAPPSADSRAALWRFAGLERDGDGLRTLTDDPHPLVRLIARSALARTESRGAHQRRDYPAPDPAFDGRHVTTRGGQPGLEHWS